VGLLGFRPQAEGFEAQLYRVATNLKSIRLYFPVVP